MGIGLVTSQRISGATVTAGAILAATLGQERERQETDCERKAPETERRFGHAEKQARTRLISVEEGTIITHVKRKARAFFTSPNRHKRAQGTL